MPVYEPTEVTAYIQSLAKEIEQKCHVTVGVEFPVFAQSAPPTPHDARVVQLLKAAIRKVYGVEAQPMGIGGGTVAAHIRRQGYHAAVWSRMDEVCHQPNEYAVIDYMVGDAKVFAHVFMNA